MIEFPLINIGYFLLKLLHFHPEEEYVFSKALRVFHLFTWVGVSTTFVFNLTSQDVPDYAKSITITMLCAIPLLPKYFVLVVYKDDLVVNYREMRTFWTLDEAPVTDKQRATMKTSVKRSLYLLKFYVPFMAAMDVLYSIDIIENLYIIPPDFAPNAFNSSIVKETIRYSFICCVILNWVIFEGFNMVVVCTLVFLKTQFDVLGRKLQNILNVPGTQQRTHINKCIKHHCFLLKFAARLNRTLSLCCLTLHLNTLLSTGIQMYLLAYANDLKTVLSTLIFTTYFLLEYSLYCFPLASLSEKAIWIGDVIYDSKWYLELAPLGEVVRFIIQRAQQDVSIKGGGVIQMDRKSIKDICTQCFSIYSVIKVMKEKYKSD